MTVPIINYATDDIENWQIHRFSDIQLLTGRRLIYLVPRRNKIKNDFSSMKMPWFLDYTGTKSTHVIKKCTNPEQLVEKRDGSRFTWFQDAWF